MGCHRRRKKKTLIICVPVSRRRRRRRGGGAIASINQSQRVGTMSGLLNIPVQIPINLGDATAISNSRNNSVTNLI